MPTGDPQVYEVWEILPTAVGYAGRRTWEDTYKLKHLPLYRSILSVDENSVLVTCGGPLSKEIFLDNFAFVVEGDKALADMILEEDVTDQVVTRISELELRVKKLFPTQWIHLLAD